MSVLPPNDLGGITFQVWAIIIAVIVIVVVLASHFMNSVNLGYGG